MTIEQKNRPTDVNILATSALKVEDFEEAASALLTLKREHKLVARKVALQILREHIGDVFYRAQAFEVLYSVALNDAVAYIESNACTENTYVLGAMIEAVTEDAGALVCRNEIQKAVLFLKDALVRRSSEELSSLGRKTVRFEEAYR